MKKLSAEAENIKEILEKQFISETMQPKTWNIIGELTTEAGFDPDNSKMFSLIANIYSLGYINGQRNERKKNRQRRDYNG